jgi:hypothetical protein
MRNAADVEQLLLDLPELEVTETSRPTDGTEILHIGSIDTTAWPVDVSVSRRRYKQQPRSIYLGFAPEEAPGDYWSVQVTPAQARHAAAQLVAAARAAEEHPTGDDPS